jgi:hypothetical protein
MAKEFDTQTNIGNIPAGDEFQRVKQTPTGGKTGEPIRESIGDRVSDVAHTVKGIFAEHSEKLFAIVALIGFTLVFYAGHIKDWLDFWRYSAFLGIILCFYLLLSFGKWLKSKFDKSDS